MAAAAALPITAIPLILPLAVVQQAHAESLLPPGAAMGLRSLDYRETGARIKVKESVLWLKSPIGEQWEMTASAAIDLVSGASAINVTNQSGVPTPIYTGASITDRRQAGDFSLKRKFGDANQYSLGGSVATSDEKDYKSKAFGINGTIDFNERNTTLAVGLGDRRDRVLSVTDKTLDAPRNARETLVGVTQIIDRHTLIQSNLTFTRLTGYLNDPYRLTFTVFTDGLSPRFVLARDSRPDSRNEWAWLTRFKRNFAEAGGVFSTEYRFTRDDWGVKAHTVAGSWLQNLGADWQAEVGLRYYSQSAADFYRGALIRPNPRYTSSDQRLAAFGSLEPSLRVVYKFDASTSLDASIAIYRQQGNWKLGGATAYFQPLEAHLINVGVVHRF